MKPAIKPKSTLPALPHTIEVIRAAAREAFTAARTAVKHAVICGQLLTEQKLALPHGEWGKWLETNCPEISAKTAERWMAAADGAFLLADLEMGAVKALPMPMSEILITPVAELTPEAREFQTDFFAALEGRTINECISGVVVDGDPEHRITRAVNGRTKGGSVGEDRKDYPKFIGEALKVISAHLAHWKSFTGVQIEATELRLRTALEKWPSPVLEMLAKAIKEALKNR